MKDKIEAGDVCLLKSGSIPFTVSDIIKNGVSGTSDAYIYYWNVLKNEISRDVVPLSAIALNPEETR